MVGSTKSSLLVFLLAAAVLAGCATRSTSDTPLGSDIKVQATPDTGGIRGVVVDSAIRPLAGALVTLQAPSGTQSTNTTANGGFSFSNLKPGTYFLRAHKAGFIDTQVSAEVKANDANPPVLKVQLLPDNSYTAPYYTVNHFKGFIECSIATPAIAYTLCSTANGWAPCSWLGIGPCVANLGNNTDDRFGTYIDVDKQPTYVQQALEWVPTQPTNPNMLFEMGADTRADWYYAQAGVKSMNQTTCGSPCILNADSQALGAAGVGNNTVGLTPVVFTGGMPGTSPGGIVFQSGMSVEQDFDVYSVIFYGFAPPHGYNYATDGEPKMPA